ncbi:hypothetical protein ACLMJK_008607 [Lecanora helva]
MAKRPKTHKLPIQQLFILCLCRFAEPIALTSVFPYLPEMIESFNVPKNAVSKWAGITSAVFSLSQATTGIFWGRASDRYGRKPAILCAMVCAMSTSLLFGFSRSLAWAVVARSLAGASNGNVGILRTTVAELVPQKELQPSAFSAMPLIWTIGSILGPAFGGALANPVAKYPKVFGGSDLFQKYKFLLPNLVAGIFFTSSIVIGILFLEETLETVKNRWDYGRVVGKFITSPLKRKRTKKSWEHKEEQSESLLRHSRISSSSTNEEAENAPKGRKTIPLAPLPYREVFTRQSSLNLLTYSILALHSIAYDQILPIFMHYPPQVNRSKDPNVHLPFKFSGGFGINSGRIGLIFTFYGIVGVIIQFAVFPPVARRYGSLLCLKFVTATFPIVYLLTPFTALLPTPTSQEIGIFIIMFFKSFASIFAFPCTTILLTNSAVSLRLLGTLNGVSTSISALGRAAGPALTGWMFSIGVSKGYMILPFWLLVGFAILGAISPWWLVEMEGFGGGEDSDDEDDQDEDGILQDEELNPRVAPVGDGLLADEANDRFPADDTLMPGSQSLSKSVSRMSEGSQLPPLKRISSPIGMKDNIGPGGNDRLSNGFGPTRSGFGAGGTSFH